MSTAFVLWGAGSLGAAQVGMLRALSAAGVRADLVVGASVGALNGVYYAARPDRDGVDQLAALWEGISSHDVFPFSRPESAYALIESLPFAPLRGLLRALGMTNYVFPLDPVTLLAAATGRANHLVDSGRFREFVRRVLPVERLEQTEIPVEVLTADVRDGRAVPISRGPALPALMASTAIPAVYPNVELAGRVLVDGALAAETSLDRAVRLGADDIYLLTPGFSCDLPSPPATVLAMAVHAHNMLAGQRMAGSIARVGHAVRLHQLPPLCPVDVLPVDFAHTAELIERATASTTYWLDHREPQPDPTTVLAGLRAVG